MFYVICIYYMFVMQLELVTFYYNMCNIYLLCNMYLLQVCNATETCYILLYSVITEK